MKKSPPKKELKNVARKPNTGGRRRVPRVAQGGAKAFRPPSFGLGISTRSAVYGCIRTVTGDPNLIITPEMGIGALRVNRTGLGACLNSRLGLKEGDLYKGDEIGSDWIVQDVINDADGRRH